MVPKDIWNQEPVTHFSVIALNFGRCWVKFAGDKPSTICSSYSRSTCWKANRRSCRAELFVSEQRWSGIITQRKSLNSGKCLKQNILFIYFKKTCCQVRLIKIAVGKQFSATHFHGQNVPNVYTSETLSPLPNSLHTFVCFSLSISSPPLHSALWMLTYILSLCHL